MAANYSDLEAGTPITWTSSGGTYAISLASLTNGSMREGGKSASLIDGSKGMPEVLGVVFEGKVGSAATNGTSIDVCLGTSPSSTAGTSNPAGLTGADASVSNPTEKVGQLIYVGALLLSNALGTGLQRSPEMRVSVLQPYIIPVILNSSGQTLGSTGTDHVITVTPYYRRTPIA